MNEDDWLPSYPDYADTFLYTGKTKTSLTSGIRVEELLLRDKELLSLFYVTGTWDEVGWYRFENTRALKEFSSEYWRQLDMNRVAHSYWTYIECLSRDTYGIHYGDCTSASASCERCLAESKYLEALHLKNRTTQDIPTLIAMLLSRDQIRIMTSDNFNREMTPTDDHAKLHKTNNWQEWYDAATEKYPTEYTIKLQEHINHWAILSTEEKSKYLERAKQIRVWCDNIPECPGVPWW